MGYRDLSARKSRNSPEMAQKLDRLITIQTITQSKDETSGEAIRTPSTFAQVWASVTPWQGREFTQAGQLSAEITTRFHIRYLDGLNPKMRIIHEGKTFEIFRIEPVGRGDRQNIYAKARDE